MSQMQTSYAKAMEPLGLQRGEENSRASHQDLQTFYRALNNVTRQKLPKKEQAQLNRQLAKLSKTLGGIKEMRGLPDIIFVVDQAKEDIAIAEANKLNIPVICLADTNANPDGINYVIPGNDDAIRSIKLITSKLADAVEEGKTLKANNATKKLESITAADAGVEVASV